MSVLFWRTRNWCSRRIRYGRYAARMENLKTILKLDLKDAVVFALAYIGLALKTDVDYWRGEFKAARLRNHELGQRFDAYRSARVGRPVINDGPGRATYPLRTPRFQL